MFVLKLSGIQNYFYLPKKVKVCPRLLGENRSTILKKQKKNLINQHPRNKNTNFVSLFSRI